jgi:hypothetical protein
VAAEIPIYNSVCQNQLGARNKKNTEKKQSFLYGFNPHIHNNLYLKRRKILSIRKIPMFSPEFSYFPPRSFLAQPGNGVEGAPRTA